MGFLDAIKEEDRITITVNAMLQLLRENATLTAFNSVMVNACKNHIDHDTALILTGVKTANDEEKE